MDRYPKSNVQLAEQLGICERQFYRRLKAKDPEALALQREDLLQAYAGTLHELAFSLSIHSDKFQFSDPKLSGALRRAANALNGAMFPPEDNSPDLSALVEG
jgi:hypothetical protein